MNDKTNYDGIERRIRPLELDRRGVDRRKRVSHFPDRRNAGRRWYDGTGYYSK